MCKCAQNMWSRYEAQNCEYANAPFTMFATCDTYAFDRNENGIAENMVYKYPGGAIAVVGASRTVYQDYNQYVNIAVASEYYSAAGTATTGDVYRKSRDRVLSETFDPEILVNTICYNLCGDPALPIYAPGGQITVTDGTYLSKGTLSLYPLADNKIQGAITDADGNVVLSKSPKVVRKTVSQETSDIICSYLEDAVTNHIKRAYIEGYHIGGKTGTSQKLDSKNEEGEIDKKIASFIGIAPADDPQICVLVVVDEPNSDVQYGSLIAAPLARSIMNDCLEIIGLEPDIEDAVDYVSVPETVGDELKDAQDKMLAKGLLTKVVGGEGTVTHQIPYSGQRLPKGATVILYTNGENPKTSVEVPYLIGLTAAECNRELVNRNLNIRIKGSGISTPGAVVISQSVEAGSIVSPTTVITVEIGNKE